MKLLCCVSKVRVENDCKVPSCNIMKLCKFSTEGQRLSPLLTKSDFERYIEANIKLD